MLPSSSPIQSSGKRGEGAHTQIIPWPGSQEAMVLVNYTSDTENIRKS